MQAILKGKRLRGSDLFSTFVTGRRGVTKWRERGEFPSHTHAHCGGDKELGRDSIGGRAAYRARRPGGHARMACWPAAAAARMRPLLKARLSPSPTSAIR